MAWSAADLPLPVLEWLPRLVRLRPLSLIADDLVAGLTLAMLLVPQSMGYSLMANLPPIQGLYTASIPPIIYFLLGSSPYISLAPFAVTALMVGDSTLSAAKWLAGVRDQGGISVEVQSAINNSPSFDAKPWDIYPHIVTIASLQCLAVGSALLFIFILRLHLILRRMLIKPLIAAFTTAASFAILTSQAKNVLGIRVHSPSGIGSTLLTWVVLLSNLSRLNWTTVGLSTATIGLVLAIPKIEVFARTWYRKAWKLRMNPVMVAVPSPDVNAKPLVVAISDQDVDSESRLLDSNTADRPISVNLTPSSAADDLVEEADVSFLDQTGDIDTHRYDALSSSVPPESESSPLSTSPNRQQQRQQDDQSTPTTMGTIDTRTHSPIRTRFPSVLIVTVIVTSISIAFNLPVTAGVAVIGEVPPGLPGFALPWVIDAPGTSADTTAPLKLSAKETIALIGVLFPSVVSLALVSYVSSLSVLQTFPGGPIVLPQSDRYEAVAADTVHASGGDAAAPHTVPTTIRADSTQRLVSSGDNSVGATVTEITTAAGRTDTNRNFTSEFQDTPRQHTDHQQELLALSVAEIISSFFGCFTSGAGLARSAVLANQTDVRSPLGCFVSVIVVFLVLSVGTAVLKAIPMAVLSSVIIVAILGPLRGVLEGPRLFRAAWTASPDLPVYAWLQDAEANQNPSEGQQDISRAHDDLQHHSPWNGSPKTRVAQLVRAWESPTVWIVTFLATSFLDSSYGILSGVVVVGGFHILRMVFPHRSAVLG